MEVNVLPSRSFTNLRAFQSARALASTLFWITRRFPKEEPSLLVDQLRRTAQAIPRSVVLGWNKRYSGLSFRHHLEEAQSACARLGLWLDVALEGGFLSEQKHRDLMAQKRQVRRMLTRLYEQRIALLA